MGHDRASRRMKAIGSALAAVLAVTVALGVGESEVVHAASMMRGPNLNIGPRISPNITSGVINNVDRFPRTPRCSDPERPGCTPQPGSSTDGGTGKHVVKQVKHDAPLRLQTGLNQHTIANELVAEIDGSLSLAQADELARRHGLVRLQSQNFPLIGSTIGLFRVTDRRSVGYSEPRSCHRCRHSFGAAEFPLCRCRSRWQRPRATLTDKGDPGAIRAGETSAAAKRIRSPTAPMSRLP